MTEYCKVCKFFHPDGFCTKGWNVFCDKADFVPSLRSALLNFADHLYYHSNTGLINSTEDYTRLVDCIMKLTRKEDRS